jgi:hypothetical protein
MGKESFAMEERAEGRWHIQANTSPDPVLILPAYIEIGY